jgi:hypothetical protein
LRREAASSRAIGFLAVNMPGTVTSQNPIYCSRTGANYCPAPSLFQSVVILYFFEVFIIFCIEM